MCPQGNFCHCGRPAVVEFAYPEWNLKLCDLHAGEYREYREPAAIYVIEREENASTNIN